MNPPFFFSKIHRHCSGCNTESRGKDTLETESVETAASNCSAIQKMALRSVRLKKTLRTEMMQREKCWEER